MASKSIAVDSGDISATAVDFREWVALARLGLLAIPAGADSERVFRVVMHNFTAAFVTDQYKSEQEFLI